jgi:hypothetical protein
MKGVGMYEAPAGLDQVIVTYESPDSGGGSDTAWFMQEIVAPDAARRSEQGWEIVSTSVFAVRQTGTAGNILFQSGGQYATQLNAVVLYRRR